MPKPVFTPGKNIAIKTPAHEYHATVDFYENILGLQKIASDGASIGFDFGDKCLWIDRVPHLSQTEVWLEIRCSDIPAAKAYLETKQVTFCADVEQLAAGFPGFWVLSPSNLVHLVAND